MQNVQKMLKNAQSFTKMHKNSQKWCQNSYLAGGICKNKANLLLLGEVRIAAALRVSQ